MKKILILVLLVFINNAYCYTLKDGIKAYNQKKDKLALHIFKKIIRKNSKNYTAHFNLANVYYTHKKYKYALKHYKITASSPSKLKVYSKYYIANIYHELGNKKKSLLYLNKITQTNKTRNLSILIDDLYRTLGVRNKGKTKRFWGNLDSSLIYSDNLNLDSNLIQVHQKGLEFDGEFVVGYDYSIDKDQIITPSFDYYLGKELRTSGYNFSGYILSLDYKKTLKNQNKITITPSIQKDNVLAAAYLTKKNIQFRYNSYFDGNRYYLKYKYSSITEDQSKYAYLSGSAHYFYGKMYFNSSLFKYQLGLIVKIKSLQDLASTASSYNSLTPNLTIKYQYNNLTQMYFKLKYELKSYQQLETGQTAKRSDNLLNLTIGGKTEIQNNLDFYYNYLHSSNSSNLNLVANTKEYTVNSFTLGFYFDF